MESGEELWISKPLVLIRSHSILPLSQMTLVEKANSAARLIIMGTAIASIALARPSIVLTGIACTIVLALMTQHLVREQSIEKDKAHCTEGFHQARDIGSAKQRYTQPSVDNPLMNVLLPEIGSNPERAPAAPSFEPAIESDINKKTQQGIMQNFDNNKGVDKRLFQDLGDSLAFDRSMITFNPTPNTQIPNDQGGFAKFCYGNMPSGKEGSPEGLLASTKPRVIDGHE